VEERKVRICDKWQKSYQKIPVNSTNTAECGYFAKNSKVANFSNFEISDGRHLEGGAHRFNQRS
jgi:hypothetical protein